MNSQNCDKKYAYVRLDECGIIKRVVYQDENKKKYIKHDGKNLYLSSIRGKYRFSDKSA